MKGQLCKHQVKVLQLQTRATARSIVRFCGTLAGSAAGGLEALASQQQQQQPQQCASQENSMDCSMVDLPQSQQVNPQPEQTQAVQSKSCSQQRNLPSVRREMQKVLQRIDQFTLDVPSKDQLVVHEEALASLKQVEVALARSQMQRDADVQHPCEQFITIADGNGMSKARLKPFFEGRRGSSRAIGRKQPERVESFTTACVPAKSPLFGRLKGCCC